MKPKLELYQSVFKRGNSLTNPCWFEVDALISELSKLEAEVRLSYFGPGAVDFPYDYAAISVQAERQKYFICISCDGKNVAEDDERFCYENRDALPD